MAGNTLIHKWTKNGVSNALLVTTEKRSSIASTSASSPSVVISGFDGETIDLFGCKDEISPENGLQQNESFASLPNIKHLKSTAKPSLTRPSGHYIRLICGCLSRKCEKAGEYLCQQNFSENVQCKDSSPSQSTSPFGSSKTCASLQQGLSRRDCCTMGNQPRNNRSIDEFEESSLLRRLENFEDNLHYEARKLGSYRKEQNLKIDRGSNLSFGTNYVKWENSHTNSLGLQTLDAFVPIYPSSSPVLQQDQCHLQCTNCSRNCRKFSCFTQKTGDDGIVRESWICQSRGDFRMFLESPEFEADLSRSFLKLINVSYYDRVTCSITYKTLRMLRACRYATSDILQCVALALCHIRRVSTKILVRNLTEAVYFFSLQIFLAHVWLLDETCPIKEWHKHIFSTFCPFDSLNDAIMSLFEAQGSLHVDSEIVHCAVHELVDL